ncbi:hypothetical protein H2200_003206 [Cladophialophora chaetospira]|uniref:N-acetyltransferase domain-containing protein n=1 Tax=Cladophialophora chaetospira TaxID=386627 RepID=A0AA39CL83_9EURO|nr:hypothetical protein H2200_003206 [Cladophialophora chaetospira]
MTFSHVASSMDDNPALAPSLSLSLAGRRVAHASDKQDYEARAHDTWERVYSTRDMGFNPDAYGNPMARNRSAAVEERVVPHPMWGFPEERPISQQSSGVSWHSAQGGATVQSQDEDQDEDPTGQENQSEGVESMGVEPTETESRTTTLDINKPTSIQAASQPRPTPATIEYPVFDLKAYGDPTRKYNPAQTARPNQRRRQVKVSSETEIVQNWHEPEPASEPVLNSKENADAQSSTPHADSPSTNSHFALNKPKTLPATPDYNKPQLKRSSHHAASTWDVAQEKLKSTPLPETYETLKQGDETPEQMITRLQEEGVREVMQRVLRKDQGEIPTTTNLALLDLLRKPLPSEVDQPQQSFTDSPTPTQPSTMLPHNMEPQSLIGRVNPTDHRITEMRKEKTEQRKWGLAKKDPAFGMHTPTQPGEGLDLDSGQPQAASVIAESYSKVERSQKTAVGPVNSAVRNQPPTFQAVDGTGLSKQYSPAVSERIQGATPTPNVTAPRASKWATTAEMRAPPVQYDSNAEGSGDSTDSDTDSLRPMAHGMGRLIRSRKPLVPEERLVGWDGEFLPPPAEWEHRPQFYNNTPEYISGFENWLGEVTVRTMSEKSATELSFGVIPEEEVVNLQNHADGIGFAPRETILEPRNAERYGHRLVKPLVTDPQNPVDFDGDAKLDLTDSKNVRFKDETANILIARHVARMKRAQQETEEKMRLQKEAEERAQAEALREQEAAAAELEALQKATPPPSSTQNIYLRPAVEADAPGMTKIINWHIENGIRPSELAPITEDDMIERIRMSQHARLAVIVAIERRKTTVTRARKHPRVRPDHPIQNIDPDYIGVLRDEPVLGWASATDWSAADYVETTTAELELYVSPGHRKSGVGRCLMDAILDATDRGHNKKSTYDFRVAQEMKHMYTGGGGRDLHKLIFQVRSYNKVMTPAHLDRIRRSSYLSPPPVAPLTRRYNYNHRAAPAPPPRRPSPPRDFSKAARLDDREDDYEIWLKEWLESYGFEEEAHLKKMGTKDSRWADVRYLAKETVWEPAKGRIPDFTHGY